MSFYCLFSNINFKQKQKGSNRILIPIVEGQQVGKWVVIDKGNIKISYFHRSHFVNFKYGNL